MGNWTLWSLRIEHKQNTLGNDSPELTTKQRLNGLSNADTLTTTIKQSHIEGERCQYVSHHGKAKLKIKQISNATDALTTTQVAGQAVQQILKATDAFTTTQVAGRSVQHKSEGRLTKQHLTLKWWEGHPCQNKDMKHLTRKKWEEHPVLMWKIKQQLEIKLLCLAWLFCAGTSLI